MAQRPQQPATGASAASLPAETLAQILACALEGLAPWERQQERVRISKVCSGWYQAAETGKELVVKDTKMAERLTKALTIGGAARRQKVKLLAVSMDYDYASNQKILTALLRLCRGLTGLELRLLSAPHSGTGSLGAAIEALKDLRHLQRFAMLDSFGYALTLNKVKRLTGASPRLRVLELQIHLRHSGPISSLGAPSSLSLDRLGMQLHPDRGPIQSYLLSCVKDSLRHLDLGRVLSDDSYTSELTPDVMAPFIDIASQLRSLRCLSWWNPEEPYTVRRYLTPVLKALKHVPLLELGVHGFKLSEILTILQPLKHLNYLSISEEEVEVDYQPFDELTADAVVDFLRSATSLRFLRLPHQLEYCWRFTNIFDVRRAAKERRVEFAFA